jgi:hypothetical protein
MLGPLLFGADFQGLLEQYYRLVTFVDGLQMSGQVFLNRSNEQVVATE